MLISLSIYYLEKTMIKEDVTTYKVVLGAIFLTISGIATIILIQKIISSYNFLNQNIK